MRVDLKTLQLDELIRQRDHYYALLHAPESGFEQSSDDRDKLRTLVQGLSLETIRRPGYWIDGTADIIVPMVVHSDLWPEGKVLRVIDYDGNAIHRFDASGHSWVYSRLGSLSSMSERNANELLLVREAKHYQWVDPYYGDVRHDVPADGDCFFSSIAGALGKSEAERAAFNLALRESVARYIEADPTRLEVASTPDTP